MNASTILIRACLLAVFLWFLMAVAFPLLNARWAVSLEDLARWGESFGGFNALLTALGFTAVAYTAWLQHQTLKSTIQDQHRQRFESQFISLLNLLRSLREDVIFKFSPEYRVTLDPDEDGNLPYRGHDAFRRAWHEVRHHINSKSTSEEIGKIYIQFVHKRFEGNFGPYFRMVYTILAMVEADPILNNKEKHRYGNILRSQLTSYELILHGLNGLAPTVSKDFAELITRFHLLKYMPKGERYKVLRRYYPDEAFTARD